MAHPKKRAVRFTANFETNLADVEAFWVECGYPSGFDALLETLEAQVIPTLAVHPLFGPDFLKRRALSLQAQMFGKRIEQELSALDATATLREFIVDDYVLLYAVLPDAVYLLSIKHHKQLSFDFKSLW